jgi:L-alanine-DL-glutamate epimerase-like enolase superfamily enzyme
LLGGRVRDSIRLYGSAGMYMSPEAYAAEASAIAALGFRAYKMRPAAGPEQDLETVRLDA